MTCLVLVMIQVRGCINMLGKSAISSISLLDTMESGVESAFICYGLSDRKDMHWYQKYMKEGFEHCFIVYWDGYTWTKLEKLYGYHYVKPIYQLNGYPLLANENIKSYFESLGYVCQNVDLSMRQESLRCKQVVTFYNCVEYVKDFLGISQWNLFTPYQLFKYVEKHYGC